MVGKKVYEILAATPGKIRREVTTMSPHDIRIRPAPNKWSVQEILAHLEDIEQVGFRERVQSIVERNNPLLPAIDQEGRAVEMRYNRKDPKCTLDSFTRQRRANLKWLRDLGAKKLKRQGVHEKVGEMSAEEFVYEWAFHDLGHLRQILEVKRYALFPRIGNMRAFYRLT